MTAVGSDNETPRFSAIQHYAASVLWTSEVTDALVEVLPNAREFCDEVAAVLAAAGLLADEEYEIEIRERAAAEIRERVAAEIIDTRRTPGRIKGPVGTPQRGQVVEALTDAAVRVWGELHTDDEYPDGWLDPVKDLAPGIGTRSNAPTPTPGLLEPGPDVPTGIEVGEVLRFAADLIIREIAQVWPPGDHDAVDQVAEYAAEVLRRRAREGDAPTMTPAASISTEDVRARMVEVFVAHQRCSSGDCLCGPVRLGSSFAVHLVDALAAAGLLAEASS